MIGYGDPERLLLVVLLIISTALVTKDARYTRTVKLLKIVPRIYLLAYYLVVLTEIYKSTVLYGIVVTGVASVYGMLLLFLAEVYLQWANLKYGKH